jgi:hypothetical protein
LNGGPESCFYVKHSPKTVEKEGTWKRRKVPSVNRLEHDGDFNIEIPVTTPELREGENGLTVEIEDGAGKREDLDMRFAWDPTPMPLPLDLRDLSGLTDIQEIGQVVDGAFDVDPARNAIRSRAPVGSDILLVLGSPHGSQEATYDVRFSDTEEGTFLGLSDFFAGHEAEDPDVGIKPGYSSSGLATLRPDGVAQAWISWGDLTKNRAEFWVVKTDPGNAFNIRKGILYRVRHQVIFEGGVNRTRFRIWPAEEMEADTWLCEEDDSRVADAFPKFSEGSFGLFQYYGCPTEWSNIRVTALP